jgi:flagellar assembly protein FliH
MSSSSRDRTGTRVLRDVAVVAPADLSQVSARVARSLVVDPELVESAIRDGRGAGYEAGYNAGYADGLNEARSHTEDLAQRLIGLVPQFGAAAAALHEQVVAVAFQIAQVLVGHELVHCEQRGRDALARALAFAPEQGHVVARLHPADLSALGDADHLAPGRSLSLVPDPSLRPGDCIVDVNGCHIDASLDAAIGRVLAVLDGDDRDASNP